MIHLSEEEIFRLAERTENQEIYNENELNQMDHLKNCPSCYDMFCSALVLQEVTSDSGYMLLSGLYDMDYAKKMVSRAEKRVLAIVNLVMNKLMDHTETVLEPLRRTEDALQFQPVLSMAGRGLTSTMDRICKVEDRNDEKTFIMADLVKNELLIQINAEGYKDKTIRARLKLESGENREIPMEIKGNIYRGYMEDFSSEPFQILIEAEG